MTARRATFDALLERESRHPLIHTDDTKVSSSCTRLNSVWRQKVIHWYFTLISALQRQHHSAETEPTGEGANNPFCRKSVHVTASLLDNYLMSLPSERALRYKRDRPAYQLLATTCLLLGMRLAQHDQIKEARQREEGAAVEEVQCGLKRAKTHRTNMNEVSAGTTPPAAATGVTIPNASTILRISAAPKSISEQHILSMVREMTGSRSFPRSKVVTALDYIHALSAASTQVSEDGSSISLGPADVEHACRLADATLRDSIFSGRRSSVVASAVITLALARSDSVNLSLASLRHKVYHSIFGAEVDPLVQASIRKTESNLLGSIQEGVPSSRNRHVVPTTHLIPLEDD